MDQPPAEPYPNFSRQAVREGSDMLLRNLQNVQRVGNAALQRAEGLAELVLLGAALQL